MWFFFKRTIEQNYRFSRFKTISQEKKRSGRLDILDGKAKKRISRESIYPKIVFFFFKFEKKYYLGFFKINKKSKIFEKAFYFLSFKNFRMKS
mmetsp:Transcript_37474/g.91078  ORF Transcript_37474/g.91078 Transcript_37474/m.91078 type:complete len:93 (-) Transcript_37474:57-335(-)